MKKKAKKVDPKEFLKSLPRKTVRYVLFQAKRINDEGGDPLPPEKLNLTEQQVKDIENALVDKDHTIEGFATHWDLGLDDIFVMANRPEKYWLFGIRPWVRVKRPVETILVLDEVKGLIEVKKTWFDSEEEGKKFFKSLDYIIPDAGADLTKTPKAFSIDYAKVLEDVDSRTTWHTKES